MAHMDDLPRTVVSRYVQERLVSGDWPVGSRIPREDEIATTLRVSRGTVRSALKPFDSAGIFSPRQGSGRVVVRLPADTRSILAKTIVFARTSEPTFAENELLLERRIMDTAATHSLNMLAIDFMLANEKTASELAEAGPAGVIASHRISSHADRVAKLKPLIDLGRPIVVQGDYPWVASFDRVISDHAAGARMLVEYFVSRGLKRIAIFTAVDPPHYWSIARRAGYEQAMTDAGLEPRVRVLSHRPLYAQPASSQSDYDDGVRTIAGGIFDFLIGPQRAEAILFDSDLATFYAAGAARLVGLEPGVSIHFAGYDNYWSTVSLRSVEPNPLSATVDKNYGVVGETLVHLFMHRMRGKTGPAELVVVPPRLVVPGEPITPSAEPTMHTSDSLGNGTNGPGK